MVAGPELQILISKRQIAAAVKRLALEIRQDYNDKYPLLVGILKGSFIFMADLVRLLNMPLEIDFIRLASYTGSTRRSGQITLIHELSSPVQDRHILVIEDIVDSGFTTAFVCDYLRQRGPASLKVCALTDKPSRREVPVTIDYLGFTVPDRFIVGYGLDLNEKYRHLPDIRFLEENK